jgi:proteasome lid subunit RPN8/RPN11
MFKMKKARRQVIWHAKRDSYTKAVGGFVVGDMGESYDYFTAGQPPHRVEDYHIIKAGKIVARYFYNSGTGQWREL